MYTNEKFRSCMVGCNLTFRYHHNLKCYDLLLKWCMQYLCFLRNVLHMIWTLIKIALIWIQGLSQLWNFEIRMITHLCHDLEIDIKGLPFLLTMTKGEIASLHNSRRKQKLHFSKEKKLLSWTSPRIASLKHQEKAKMCYRAYLKKSKYANLHIFEFASL